MPGLVADFGDGFLSLGVAQEEAVVRQLFMDDAEQVIHAEQIPDAPVEFAVQDDPHVDGQARVVLGMSSSGNSLSTVSGTAG